MKYNIVLIEKKDYCHMTKGTLFLKVTNLENTLNLKLFMIVKEMKKLKVPYLKKIKMIKMIKLNTNILFKILRLMIFVC